MSDQKIEERHYNKDAVSVPIKYASFADRSAESLPPVTPLVESGILYDNPINNHAYDTPNTDVIALSTGVNSQFEALQQLKETHFPDSDVYRVYLTVAETEHFTPDLKSYARTKFALQGLKIEGDKVIPHEVVSDIEVFAEDALYNFADTEEGKVIEAYWVDEDIVGTTQAPFGQNLRVFVKTQGALGKKVYVQVYEYSIIGSVIGYRLAQGDIESTILSTEQVITFDCSPELF